MSECEGHKYSKFCQFSLQTCLSIFPFRFSLPKPKPKFFFTGTWAGRECFSLFSLLRKLSQPCLTDATRSVFPFHIPAAQILLEVQLHHLTASQPSWMQGFYYLAEPCLSTLNATHLPSVSHAQP